MKTLLYCSAAIFISMAITTGIVQFATSSTKLTDEFIATDASAEVRPVALDDLIAKQINKVQNELHARRK